VTAPVYRMRHLCELTGLSRQAIHFYIQQGLLPEGTKTGRNTAWYGPEHVERLRVIRRLQEEQHLPLKAIRALLAGETAGLDPARRALLAEVGARLGADQPPAMLDAAALCERHGVPPADVARAGELGLVATRSEAGRLQVAAESAWLVEVWGQLRALGLDERRGFCVDDLQVFHEVVSTLLEKETAMLVDRVADLPAADLAVLIERLLPLLHTVLIQLHTAAVRHFFAAVGERRARPPAR
jgi:DNA-binding transcriptional MerR regulator